MRIPAFFFLLCLLLGACQSPAASQPSSPDAELPRLAKGADVSEALYAEANGVVYRDTDGQAKAPLQIFADHGFTWVRVRLMVDPSPASPNYGIFQDLEYVKTTLLDAKARGFQILLDLHLSSFWADPGRQNTPARWVGLETADLAAAVRSETKAVMEALVAQGTPPDMVQVGNEVNNGMLWPAGKISASGWAAFTALQAAGVAGLDEGRGAAPMPIILVHIAKTQKTAADVVTWYRNFVNSGGRLDAIGLSYYSMWHGNLALLGQTIAALRTAFPDKPVWLAEAAYYWSPNRMGYSGTQVPYAQSPAGQVAFLKALRATVAEAGGVGIFYWGAAHTQSSRWYEMGTWKDDTSRRSLFDDTAKGLPGLDAF